MFVASGGEIRQFSTCGTIGQSAALSIPASAWQGWQEALFGQRPHVRGVVMNG